MEALYAFSALADAEESALGCPDAQELSSRVSGSRAPARVRRVFCRRIGGHFLVKYMLHLCPLVHRAHRCLPLREEYLNTSLLCAGGGEARGTGIRPLALCSVGDSTPHVSPSGCDWRDGIRPRSYRGTRPRFASSTLMSLRTIPPLHAHQPLPDQAGAPSGSDIRVPSRVLSAAKQGRAERPRGWVPL